MIIEHSPIKKENGQGAEEPASSEQLGEGLDAKKGGQKRGGAQEGGIHY